MTSISASTPRFLQLGLDVLGHDARVGQIAAHHVTIGDGGLERLVWRNDAFFFQDFLGLRRIIRIPVLALGVAEDRGGMNCVATDEPGG